MKIHSCAQVPEGFYEWIHDENCDLTAMDILMVDSLMVPH